MNSMLRLTKHLYNCDEVIYSLITSLINKRELKECYFWTFELYYSEIDVFPILWKIYLDFYFKLNPVLERHFRKHHAICKKERNNKSIAFIIKNLFQSKSCYDVFILVQYSTIAEHPTMIYKGRKPKWCLQYPSEYQNWLRSIDKNHYENMVYYTKKLLNTKPSSEVFGILVQYFAYKMEIEIDTDVYAFIETRMDGHDLEYMLAMILHLNMPERDFVYKNIFTLPTKKELLWIKETQEYDIECHKILKYKRLYEIDDSIGCFPLAREKVDSMIDMLRNNWEFYAYRTPLWKKRIDNFGGIVDEETKKIIFEDEEKLELFYESFGLEPDEQSLDIQNKSAKEITKKNNAVFIPDNTIIPLSDDFQFKYMEN